MPSSSATIRSRAAGVVTNPVQLKRVVCVDDNAFVLRILGWYLETRGFVALLYSNGKEALDVIAKGNADAVVLDYHMPEMNGGELAAAIRSLSPTVPILMFSGDTDIPAHTLALVDSFVQKGQPNGFPAVADFVDSLRQRHQRTISGRSNARSLAAARRRRSLAAA